MGFFNKRVTTPPRPANPDPLASQPVSEAEQALKSWRIQYEKKPDGSLFVPGSMDISGKRLTKLPDLSCVTVHGHFYCSKNQLTSLEGAPRTVGGDFYCNDNQLTSLKGAPPTVGGFHCYSNQLTSLKGAPRTVVSGFSCTGNQLTSLEHAPHTVGGGFYCNNNQLTSLEHAPRTVGGDFFCYGNQITSLEGAPTNFKYMESDLGDFFSWNDVPEELRVSPQTKARLEQGIYNAVVLQNNVAIKAPLKFKPR